MKQLYYILLLITGMTTISGCEKIISVSTEDTAPKAVLNAIINCTSNTHSVKLSESVSLFSTKEASRIENSNLQLQINGQDKEILFDTYKDLHSYYRFTEPLVPGDKVTISGHTSKHGSFSGSDFVPFPPEIVSVKTEWFTGKENNLSYLRTLIKIKDKLDTKNFYRIVIRDKTLLDAKTDEASSPWNLSEVCIDQEIIFNNVAGIGGEDNDEYKYRIFGDDLFQGKEYTLNVYIRKDNFKNSNFKFVRQFVKVEIHALSENLYKYLRSLELALEEDYFQEPVKIYTNIKGGYGVIGIYNVAERTVEL